MSLETEVKSLIGGRPMSYIKVEGAWAYDDSDPSKGSRQQRFADAYSTAMVDYFNKGQSTPNKGQSTPSAQDVLVAVLVRLTDKQGRTELVHLRIVSDAYFETSNMQDFAEVVVYPNTKLLSNGCRKVTPAAQLVKCEAVVFETTHDEFCKIVRRIGDSHTINTVEFRESLDGHIETNRRLDPTNDFDLALMKFAFRWNMKADGLSDEEIDERWKHTPWCKEDSDD